MAKAKEPKTKQDEQPKAVRSNPNQRQPGTSQKSVRQLEGGTIREDN